MDDIKINCLIRNSFLLNMLTTWIMKPVSMNLKQVQLKRVNKLWSIDCRLYKPFAKAVVNQQSSVFSQLGMKVATRICTLFILLKCGSYFEVHVKLTSYILFLITAKSSVLINTLANFSKTCVVKPVFMSLIPH